MRNDRIRSPEELARVAGTLVDVAEEQSDVSDKLLDKLKMALEEFDRRTTALTRDMPNNIARPAAAQVVREIADLVTGKVSNVLQPAEARLQNFLTAMEEPLATYRCLARHRIVRHPVLSLIIFACLSGFISAVLVVLAMRIGIV